MYHKWKLIPDGNSDYLGKKVSEERDGQKGGDQENYNKKCWYLNYMGSILHFVGRDCTKTLMLVNSIEFDQNVLGFNTGSIVDIVKTKTQPQLNST